VEIVVSYLAIAALQLGIAAYLVWRLQRAWSVGLPFTNTFTKIYFAKHDETPILFWIAFVVYAAGLVFGLLLMTSFLWMAWTAFLSRGVTPP
jgi:hypothetical protein